jgi:hypothetical protein
MQTFLQIVQASRTMHCRPLLVCVLLTLASCQLPYMAQEVPARNAVDWGGGYHRYVADPPGVTAATSAATQRTPQMTPARTAGAQPADAAPAPAARDRAVDWGGGYVRYVSDPAGVTKATAGAGKP